MLSRIIALVRTSVAIVVLATLLVACNAAPSDPVRIAVAANFAAVQEQLAARFTEKSGYPVESSFGATGALYSQIANGAPFQVFLSADGERPERLEKEGLTAPGSRFTYALGALVLYAPGGLDGGNGEEALRRGAFQHLAICKPALAPYGRAAQQTLEKLGLWDRVQPALVQGDNVTQAFQFIETGNAEIGFVALSQVIGQAPEKLWRVSAALHEPILQDAVLLKTGAEHEGARAFLAFLQGPEARQMIAAGGYTLPEGAK
jgi:molybdate transport system substrate-binding protein